MKVPIREKRLENRLCSRSLQFGSNYRECARNKARRLRGILSVFSSSQKYAQRAGLGGGVEI
jgi:hypothetical protein